MNKSLERSGGYHRSIVAGLFVAVLFFSLAQRSRGADPAWWTARGVKNTAPASDYSMVNQGQAKWFALKAEEELRAKLPAGFNGPILPTLPTGDNYAPINQGQLKALVQPLYIRIQQAIDSLPPGPLRDAYGNARPQGQNGGTYPWSDTTTDDQSYAPVNLGQLKYILSIEFVFPDADGDGLPDWWETLYGFNPTSSGEATGDFDGDGLTNLQEYNLGTNPTLMNPSAPCLISPDLIRHANLALP
ncbi:MAG: hypothetical protein QM813_07300 [Verrucomicrobiota bacterium]